MYYKKDHGVERGNFEYSTLRGIQNLPILLSSVVKVKYISNFRSKSMFNTLLLFY